MIIYPKNPIVQTTNDSRWINLKSNLYNTYVKTGKMRYRSMVSSNTEIFELYNNYIQIKIYQSLLIKAGSDSTKITIKECNSTIDEIKKIINRYYKYIY